MCIRSHSESGQPGGFVPCEAYIKLLSEKSRLEGRCASLEEGNKLNMERIKKQDAQLVEMLAEVEKHKSRRDHFEDLLNRSIEHENEWTQRAIKAEAENAALRQELESSQQTHLDTIIERDALKQENQLLRAENVNLSMAHGPGNHTDWMLTRASKYEQLHKDLEKLRQERDALVQVSAEVCPKCGWAMKFPDEPCRNCEVIALRKVREKADVLVNQMLPECEDCGTPCESYALARLYQEARHAG